MNLAKSARLLSVLIPMTSMANAGVVRAQSGWELVTKTATSETSIAIGSIQRSPDGIVSAWVQHRGVDGSLVAERHEVNCGTRERRLLEVWAARVRPDSAPVAMRESGWLPTLTKTPMRKLVDRACAR